MSAALHISYVHIEIEKEYNISQHDFRPPPPLPARYFCLRFRSIALKMFTVARRCFIISPHRFRCDIDVCPTMCLHSHRNVYGDTAEAPNLLLSGFWNYSCMYRVKTKSRREARVIWHVDQGIVIISESIWTRNWQKMLPLFRDINVKRYCPVSHVPRRCKQRCRVPYARASRLQ